MHDERQTGPGHPWFAVVLDLLNFGKLAIFQERKTIANSYRI